jgi:poly-gamma-glutamate synthesis protein (capsule biosynthesis protein)
MLDLLDQQGISYFGGGADLTRAHTPLLIERKGVRIALLGYNEYFPRSFEAGFDHPGIAWSEDAQVRLDIANARRRYGADLVIPVMHWGWEYQPTAGPRQHQLARLLIDAGADAVVGGHPHVTQDTEIYRDKPIIYSLGNFVFDELTRENEDIGWILHMELDRQGVARWRTFVVHLDKQGYPRPRPTADGLCWTRGQPGASVCGRKNAG